MKIGDLSIWREKGECGSYLSISLDPKGQSYSIEDYVIEYPETMDESIKFHTQYNKWYKSIIKEVDEILERLKPDIHE